MEPMNQHDKFGLIKRVDKGLLNTVIEICVLTFPGLPVDIVPAVVSHQGDSYQIEMMFAAKTRFYQP